MMEATAERPGSPPVHSRVLVIEDDALIRLVVSATLSEEGYAVQTAPDGASAFELVCRAGGEGPAVILMDLLMPEVGGEEFLARYATSPVAHAPVVVFSATSPRDVASRPHVAEVVAGPILLSELAPTVARHAGHVTGTASSE